MNICIFGDSISWGAYDPQNGGWANRLRNYFEEQKKDIDIYNLGISGDVTTNLLNRIKIEAKSRKVDVIVFAIGANDAQFIYSTKNNLISADDFRTNLEKLYEIARKFTSKIIFIGLASVDESKIKPVPWNTDITYTNERIKLFDRIIEDFCFKNNLKFVPINDLLNNDDLADGVHPNTQGHIKMFERIKPEIEFSAKIND
jgi:lysophospholipase L1-like esterase